MGRPNLLPWCGRVEAVIHGAPTPRPSCGGGATVLRFFSLERFPQERDGQRTLGGERITVQALEHLVQGPQVARQPGEEVGEYFIR